MKTTYKPNNKLIIAILSIFLIMLGCFCAMSVSYAKEGNTSLEIKEGKSYRITCEKVVYEEPSDDSDKVLRKDLKPSTMKHAVEGKKYAKLEEGTVITCLEKEGDWIRIPSGWIKYTDGDLKPVKKKKS